MRILILQHGDFSGINPAVVQAFRDAGADVTCIDLADRTLRGWRMVAALPPAWREKRFGLLRRGYGGLHGAVKRSAWYAGVLAAEAEEAIRPDRFDCSVSMQTIIPVLRPRVPNFVFTDHTILCNRRYEGGDPAAERWQAYLPFERRTIEAAAAVFTMSEHTRSTVVDDYGVPPERAVAVGGGCLAPFTVSPPDGRYERHNIVFVGYDWERKGGPELVDAFGDVREALPSATLTIVGCSPRVDGPGIEVAGAVPPGQIGQYLSRATLFCMPSRREPFGIAYLEAMRAGLPVVALRQGAVLEFVIDGDTGLLITPRRPRELSDALIRLLGDADLCRRMGTRGRALVEDRYTWAHVQRTMIDVMHRQVFAGS